MEGAASERSVSYGSITVTPSPMGDFGDVKVLAALVGPGYANAHPDFLALLVFACGLAVVWMGHRSTAFTRRILSIKVIKGYIF